MTYLDFILLGVMLLSALLAMMRGFTREVFSIVAWAAAAAAALYLYPQFQDWARTQIPQSQTLADAALVGGIFLITLAVVSFATMRLSDVILDSRVGAIDRSLGFVFGLGRGLLLVVIAFLFFTWLVNDEARQPAWVKNARFKPLLQNTGELLIAQLPEDPESDVRNFLQGRDGEGVTPDGAEGEASPPAAAGERQNLDQLLENSRGQQAPRR